jgi:cation-transporting ATPase I
VRAAATAAAAGGAYTFARFSGTRTRASTVALAALVGAQLGQTLVAGAHSPLVVASNIVSTAALVAVVETPVVSRFFGCRPLGPLGWAIAATSATVATAGAVVAGHFVVPGRDAEASLAAVHELDARSAAGAEAPTPTTPAVAGK